MGDQARGKTVIRPEPVARLQDADGWGLRRELARARRERPCPQAAYPRGLRQRVVAWTAGCLAKGVGFAEISAKLGMPQNTIRNWISATQSLSTSWTTPGGKDRVFSSAIPTAPVTVSMAPVRIVEERQTGASRLTQPAATPARAGTLTLSAPGGLVLTGLRAEEAALILERLLRTAP